MKKISFFLAFALVLVSCQSGKKKSSSGTDSSISLSAAGATFPLPFYNMSFDKYAKLTGEKVSYGGIGSGGGIRSLKDKVVDFGASDAFLSDEEMTAMPAPIVHIPTCSGAVVVAYNLPGVQEVKLNSDLLSKIFMGQITKWNDASITKLNPTVKFPDMVITVVYRSDGSGTTNMFTDYLSKVSNEWKTKIGSGKTVKWIAGIGAKGNPGVAGTVNHTIGAIGYIGSEYAFAEKISTALLQNQAGNYIKPSIASVSAAGKGDIPADTRVMITNSSAADAYPISGFTWLILYKEQNYGNRTLAQTEATLKLLDWMLGSDAQEVAKQTNYAPLPAAVVAKAKAILRTVTYNGKPVLK
ncbi:MAG: phosphate ABC transporter substrate-binding protein PstS [Paludibacter sp.]|nr:phosphate ABC transporter substrate-binding protein PstS [Paludibacter sp.]